MQRRHQMHRMQPLPKGVVRVDRATMWGNPFRSDKPDPAIFKAGATMAAEAYRLWLGGHPELAHVEPERRAAILGSLGRLHGKDLACWCPVDVPHGWCHADVLLDLARAAEPAAGDALGRPEGVPDIALSVRQPWAWALIFGGKDVENRGEMSVQKGGMRAQVGKRIAIHAGKGMTREEYESAAAFMAGIGVVCPAAADLLRGGIIGTAYLASIVNEHISKWFFGPRGLCLIRPEPVPFIGASGELGMFAWNPSFAPPAPPARWMLPEAERAPRKAPRQEPAEAAPATQIDMFGEG
jgi:hypothetical protein